MPSPRSLFKDTLLLRASAPVLPLLSCHGITSRSDRELGWSWTPSAKKTGNSRGRYQARKIKDKRIIRRSSCLVLIDKRITQVALGLRVSTVGPKGNGAQGEGFTGDRQTEPFVPCSAAQLCTSVSSRNDTGTAGTGKCPALRVYF